MTWTVRKEVACELDTEIKWNKGLSCLTQEKIKMTWERIVKWGNNVDEETSL